MPALDIGRLAGSLSAGLQPLYVIHGEEELLRIEALDVLRRAAVAQGYTERESHVADGAAFDWSALLAQTAAAGLFAELKWLEIAIPSGKPGKSGGEALQWLAANLPADTVTAVLLPKLDRTQLHSKWFEALARSGTVLEAKPVTAAALPAWIRERLTRHGLDIEADALAVFAARVEGNLLAAKQEIDKLALLYPSGHLLNMADTEAAVADVARFDAFDLSSAWMAADAARTARLLDNLAAGGEEPVLAVAAVAEDLRTLLRLAAALKQGKPVAAVRNELRLWGDKQTLAPKAVARIPAPKLMAALQECARIDRQIKGAEAGDAWTSLRQLLAGLAA